MMTDAVIIGNSNNDNNKPTWVSICGNETLKVLNKKFPDNDEAQNKIRKDSQEIIQKCIDPNGENQKNGLLVIGKVQSGKTLSFTTVTSLAADNNYKFIIVIAGITDTLRDQTVDRLTTDLGITALGKFSLYMEPTEYEEGFEYRVKDDSTIIVVIKKHKTHIDNLKKLFQRIFPQGCEEPTLIIDDEADQASLNTYASKGEPDETSATYQSLTNLKNSFKKMTYLQYTATPQANLLINTMDEMSADDAYVLEPGDKYIGCDELFNRSSQTISLISMDDIQLIEENGTPESLRKALLTFYLGLSEHLLNIKNHGSKEEPRSMIIHVAREIVKHLDFKQKVSAIRTLFMDRIEESNHNFKEECHSIFENLSQTESLKNNFETLYKTLPSAISHTKIKMLNSHRDGDKLDITHKWNKSLGWIFVGGDLLNRGTTIEGLMVTYMSRSPGVGNADTIQQRARFCGYKKDYLGLIRIFVSREVSDLYKNYVTHEKHLRKSINNHLNSGESLKEWRRMMLLNKQMNPTRGNILKKRFKRFKTNQWFYPRRPHQSKEQILKNNETIISFMDKFSTSFKPNGLVDRRPYLKKTLSKTQWDNLTAAFTAEKSDENQHNRVFIPLKTVLNDFLTNLEYGFDSNYMIATILAISEIVENDNEAVCEVVQMRPKMQSRRKITVEGDNQEEEIESLEYESSQLTGFGTGANPNYVGDRYVYDPESAVTIQLFKFDLDTGPNTEVIHENVRTIGVHLHKDKLQSIITQVDEVDDYY